MKKRDFMQAACIQFMPELHWDIDKALQYAEKLWLKLDEKGYGEPRQTGPQEIKKAYDKLTPVMKSAFDLFWLAFAYKQGKDEAAASWLQMGELTKADYDKIIAAAKRTAAARTTLPEGQVPIMAQGWLNKRRWLDSEDSASTVQAKQQSQEKREMQLLMQDLAHAKRMHDTTHDEGWLIHIEKLTKTIKTLRDNHAQQQP